MSTSYVFFVAVFLLLSITTRCTVGELLRSEVSWSSCGETSWSREIIITNPAEITDVCQYHLKVYSPLVVQLHVKFSTTLAQPRNNNGTLECVDEYLEIAGLRFCGTHNQEHIYVPFNGTQGVDEITLTVRLASRSRTTGNTFMPFRPNWYLRIFQLQSDFYNLAPTGCLQYYIAEKGVITSFNYNDRRGIYPSNMNYSVCIQSPVESTGIILKFKNFDICDGDNCDQGLPPGIYCNYVLNEDSVSIPSSAIVPLKSNYFGDNYYCGRSLHNATVFSLPVDRKLPNLYKINVFSGIHNNAKKSGFEIEYIIVKA